MGRARAEVRGALRRGRRLALAALTACGALAGLAADHLWNVSHARSCPVAVLPALGGEPPYQCPDGHIRSTAATKRFSRSGTATSPAAEVAAP